MSLAQSVLNVLRKACLSSRPAQASRRKSRRRTPALRSRFRGFEPLEDRSLLSVTLLSETFETGFPTQNGWSVADANSAGRAAYWASVNSRFGGEGTHGGSQKGYCAGNGYSGWSSSPKYRDSMTATMSRSLDLSGYSSASLSFWYKIPSIEANKDFARVYIDSTVVWEKSAATTAWTQQTIALNSFGSGVHTLKFEFSSNTSTTAEGWYLDDIAVTAEQGALNDAFANRTSITGASATVTGSNVGATKQTGEPNHAGNTGGASVWWTWTAPASGSATIDTIGSNFDTLLGVYTGSAVTSLTTVASDDNSGGAGTSKVTFNAVAGTAYQIAVDGRNGASGNITLNLVSGPPAPAEPDDQISEARALASLASQSNLGPAEVLAVNDTIDTTTDVDMYSFTVTAGQCWGFDIDLTAGSSLDSQLRLFDASGKALSGASNNNAAAPGELASAESYVTYTFTTAGTYYVGVSGAGNANYNAVTGAGDAAGSTGAYRLYASPVGYTTGLVQRPATSPTSSSPAVIDVTLHRVDGGAAEGIQTNRTTWIIAHGRADMQDAFVGNGLLATVLGQFSTTDQVLTLDWRKGAADNSPSFLGLQGSGWIPNVAAFVASATKALGLSTSQINLVGHSWGTFMVYEIAKSLGSVRSIVALDPAPTGSGGYTGSQVNFGSVSDIAWAFYGNGAYGSSTKAATADEAFAVWPYTGLPILPWDTFMAEHMAPVALFTQIVQQNLPGQPHADWASRFSLNRLLQNTRGSWRYNAYDSRGTSGATGSFEGVFAVTLSGDWFTPSAWTFSNFRYGTS